MEDKVDKVIIHTEIEEETEDTEDKVDREDREDTVITLMVEEIPMVIEIEEEVI